MASRRLQPKFGTHLSRPGVRRRPYRHARPGLPASTARVCMGGRRTPDIYLWNPRVVCTNGQRPQTSLGLLPGLRV